MDDLRLRDLLDQISARRTALDHALGTLRLVVEHASTWADPDRTPRDPAEVLATIKIIAADGAARAVAMRKEEQSR